MLYVCSLNGVDENSQFFDRKHLLLKVDEELLLLHLYTRYCKRLRYPLYARTFQS